MIDWFILIYLMFCFYEFNIFGDLVDSIINLSLCSGLNILGLYINIDA